MHVGFATVQMLTERLTGRNDHERGESPSAAGQRPDHAVAPASPMVLPTNRHAHRAGRGRYRRRPHHRDAA